MYNSEAEHVNMDIYGNPIEGESLANGGAIGGDLEIDGDVVINGDLDVQGTVTSIDQLEVKDALITVAVSNAADTINTGLLAEHSGGSYGGLVRRGADKRWVALNSITPKPGPNTVIPASDATVEMAQLATDEIKSDSNNLNISSTLVTLPSGSAIAYSGKPQQGILSSVADYIVQSQDRMAVRSNNGRLSLETNGLNADIILESSENVIIDSGANSGDSILLTAQSGDISLTANSDLTLSCTGQVDIDAPVVRINAPPNDYLLANTRGLAGQILTSNGLGDSSWQTPVGGNPFDQTLNTTDNVRFAQVDIGVPATGFNLPTTRGTVGQYMRQGAGGVVLWSDVPGAAHGVMSMVGNGLQTVFAVSGVYTQIVGTRAGSQLQDFSFAPNVLQYTGNTPAEFLVNVSQSWIHESGTPDEFRMAIFVNGAIVASSEQRCNLDSDSDYPRSSSTNAIVSLSNGDQIDVRIGNFDDTTPCTVVDHTLSIVKVGLTASGGGSGDVSGPAVATDNGLAIFDGTSGKLLQDSPAVLQSSGELGIIGANSRLNLDNSLREFQLRNLSYFELFQRDSPSIGGGNPDIVLNTQNNRLNVFRETWLQGNVVVNSSPNNYVLPTTAPASGQHLVADSVNTTTWRDPVAFHCNAMVNNPSSNVFTAIGQTQVINGLTVKTGLDRGGPWLIAGTQVQYNGARNLVNCKIELSGTLEGLGATRRFGLQRNGAFLSASFEVFATANLVSFYTSVYASVFSGDVISPVVTALVNISQIRVNDMYLTITEL